MNQKQKTRRDFENQPDIKKPQIPDQRNCKGN
jgi:hypothetical protein